MLEALFRCHDHGLADVIVRDRVFPGNLNLTCNNWTSGTFGSTMVGHIDRRGLSDTVYAKSWNASHMSRSCSPDDLRATGGNGFFYCFAQ